MNNIIYQDWWIGVSVKG